MEEKHFLTIGQAAQQSPGRPAASSVWRWCRKGVKTRAGEVIKLAHLRVGGRVFVARDELFAFFRALADADASHFDRPKPQPRPAARRASPARRQKEIARAENELRAAGWIS